MGDDTPRGRVAGGLEADEEDNCPWSVKPPPLGPMALGEKTRTRKHSGPNGTDERDPDAVTVLCAVVRRVALLVVHGNEALEFCQHTVRDIRWAARSRGMFRVESM